jgi:Uma2 family endonuclease
MGEPARTVPTFDELYEQIERLPACMTGEILEPGVLRTMSRPGSLHRFSARRVLSSLGSHDLAEGGTGWWFEVEAEIRLSQELLAVADISGWRVERVPEFLDDNPITVVPAFCCEILSPSGAREDRRLKLPLYARSGVQWTWLVDPAAHLVEIDQTIGEVPALVMTAKDDDVIALPPFGTDFDIGLWWLENLPSRGKSRG